MSLSEEDVRRVLLARNARQVGKSELRPLLQGYNAGLEAAAMLLEKTAEDFEQMAKIQQGFADKSTNHLTRMPHRAAAAAHGEKAKLLRGQASHVRGLKK